MSISREEWVQRMELLAAAMERTPLAIVTASARVYTTAIQSNISVIAPSGKLRGVGRNGARVGVASATQSSGPTATAIVKAIGPLHLIERTNRDHTVPRAGSSRRRLRINARSGGTNWITGPITVKGSKGREPFAKGVIAGSAIVSSTVPTVFDAAVRSVFP